MRPPCELVQKEYLPMLRARLANALSQKGYSQTEIAETMLITQAAVSKYLKQGVSSVLPIDSIDRVVNRLMTLLTEDSPKTSSTIREICSGCMNMRIGSHICRAHQERIPFLSHENCQACSQLLGGADNELSVRAGVIQDMLDALLIIEGSLTFERIIPQVRANLVSCAEDARSTADVAGVPGRIFLVNGRPKIHAGPQFGASKHTATLLLWAKDQFDSVRSALCISGRDTVVDATRSVGFEIIQLDESAAHAEEIIQAAVLKLQGTRKRKLTAIHVPGGIGIEPILYLFGFNAVTLSRQCEKISKLV